MALIGKAAMILSFDIESAAIDEHDNWHNHEHLPERLSIPGFRRGSRWVALSGSPRYFVMYEVDDLCHTGVAALSRTAQQLHAVDRAHDGPLPRYEARLLPADRQLRPRPRPPWPADSLKPGAGQRAQLREWLAEKLLPALPAQPGPSSAHLFEAALTPEETKEQRIRGKDCAVDWVVLVSGFNRERVASLADGELSRQQLEQHGAIDVAEGHYQMDYSLTGTELSQE